MRRLLFLLLMSGSLIQETSVAQKTWTLDDCIDYAIENNLTLDQSRIRNEINQENYHQAIREMLPDAGLSSGSGVYFGKTVDPTTYDFVTTQFFSANYSLGASVGVFNGFSKLNTISFNKLSYLAGIEESKQKKNEIAFNVLTHYFDVMFYRGLLVIAREQKMLSELNLKKAKTLYRTGLNAKSDLLEMESRMAEEELYVVQTQNYLSAAILDLKQTMNYKESGDFVLDTIVAMDKMDGSMMMTDSVYGKALRMNPGIKAMEFKASAARKNLAVARGRLLPNVSLSGGYGSNYAVTRGDENPASLWDQFKRNASQSISFSLSVPLFYGWSRHSDVTLAKLGMIEAKTELDISRQQLYQEIEKNDNELMALYAEYEQTVKQLDAAMAAYQVAEKKLGQGLIDAIDYYNSKNLMAKAESNVLRTRLQYELKRRTIDFFIGNPIYTEK